MAILLAFTTFVVVAGILMFPVVLSGGRQQRNIRRRLESIDKARARDQASPELNLLRSELLSALPPLHRLLIRWSWTDRLRSFISQAGLEIKPGVLLLASGVLGMLGYVVALNWFFSHLLAIPFGIAGVLLPFAVVAFKRHRRFRAFEKSLPEALDLLARAVRAGHAFTTGLEMIGKELPEPLAGEFRITFEEQNLGLPLKDVLLNLAERVPIIDVRFFVTALLIQKESGGNLAEILDSLAAVIRDRFRIYGEVKTKTAHGRLTGGVLIALPPLVAMMIGILNPTYLKPLVQDVWGPYMLVTAATMQVIGSLLLWKIVNIEV
jgi:tight adherence protein B